MDVYKKIMEIVEKNSLVTVFDAIAYGVADRIKKTSDEEQLKRLRTTHRELEKMSNRFLERKRTNA